MGFSTNAPLGATELKDNTSFGYFDIGSMRIAFMREYRHWGTSAQTINFPAPFAEPPIVSAECEYGAGAGAIATASTPTTASVNIGLVFTSNNWVNDYKNVSIIAIGKKPAV